MSDTNHAHKLFSFKNQSLSPSSSTSNHANHENDNYTSESDLGWKTVSNGTKHYKSDPSNFPINSPKKKSEVLAQNKYFVPRKLEKSLHHNSGIAAHFSLKLQRDGDKVAQKSLRCHMRNQRRKKRRAQERLSREMKSNKDADNSEKKG